MLHVPDLDAPITADQAGQGGLPFASIRLDPIESLPSVDRAKEAGTLRDLSDAESDAYFDLVDRAFGEGPRHQAGGWPTPIQGDGMELEAQLAFHGIYCGDDSERHSPKAKSLESGAQDWRLLLQLDSDEDMNVMWGDAGMLYVWVREQDAMAGRFDNAWAILQCH